MAEITYSVSSRVSGDGLSGSVSANAITAAMSVPGLRTDVMTMSSSAVDISTANLTSAGLAIIQSIDTSTASTCLLSVSSGGSTYAFSSLRSGEAVLFRMAPGVSYKAQGTSGSRIRVDITEG